MSKDKGTMLIETLADGSEHENFFPDSKMAEEVLKTRGDRFKKAKTARARTSPDKIREQPEDIPDKPSEQPKNEDTKTEQKFTFENLIELGQGSGGRKRLQAMAKKMGVSAGGKNEEISKRIFEKAKG